jgi:hypothetical protein
MDLDIDRDRETIVRTAQEFHRRYLARSLSDDAWAPAIQVAAAWSEAGRIDELLRPLLEHEATAVRYAAAAYLIQYAPSEQAWSVLANIHAHRVREDGFYKTQAGFLLRQSGRLA